MLEGSHKITQHIYYMFPVNIMLAGRHVRASHWSALQTCAMLSTVSHYIAENNLGISFKLCHSLFISFSFYQKKTEVVIFMFSGKMSGSLQEDLLTSQNELMFFMKWKNVWVSTSLVAFLYATGSKIWIYEICKSLHSVINVLPGIATFFELGVTKR